MLIVIPRWISFGVAGISMCFVYFKASKEEEEYKDKKAPAGWLWFVQKEEGQDVSRQMRSRRMARQAFWYLLNFFMTYVGITVVRVMQAFGGAAPFGLWCFAWIFGPWQGFWNAVIYIRPRFIRNREKNPEMSIWQAILTEDEYDHRLGARAMRSTVAPTKPNFSASFFGSVFRKSNQAEDIADAVAADNEEGGMEQEVADNVELAPAVEEEEKEEA